MSTIVTRAGKGSPLTNTELDSNFSNLNTDKYESGSNVSVGTLAASGAASFAAGAVGTPSVTFTGDLNTGIWSPAADTIAFSEGGVEAMRLNSSGNLGVGTASPIGRLHVSDTSSPAAPTDSVSTQLASFGGYSSGGGNVSVQIVGSARGQLVLGGKFTAGAIDGGGIKFVSGNLSTTDSNAAAFATIIGQQTTGDNATGGEIRINTRVPSGALAERVRIDSAGNLGLGVTPSAWNTGGNLVLPGSRHIAFANAVGTVVTNGFNDGSWKYVATAAAARYDQNAGAHQWFTAASGTAGNAISFTTAMTLDASGNLGVGTTSPIGKIDVSGSSVDGIAFRVTNSTVSNQYLTLSMNGATGFGVPGWDNSGVIESVASGSGSGTRALLLSAYSGPILFHTSSARTERMRIDSTGNVGIGTTAPTNLVSLGGNAARTVWMERHTTADTAGNDLTLQAGGATSGATDKAGGNLLLASGIATGSGSSALIFSTATAGAAGTSNRTPTEKMRLDGAGNVGINESAPDYKLDVNGTFGFTPGSSVTPVDNGDVVIEATDNTTLTFKLKGSDGNVRTGTITLS